MSTEYIVFWKNEHGQQVSTTVDAHNQPVRRSREYVDTNDIPILESEAEVFHVLEMANGEKFAITPTLARHTLGWSL